MSRRVIRVWSIDVLAGDSMEVRTGSHVERVTADADAYPSFGGSGVSVPLTDGRVLFAAPWQTIEVERA